MSAPYISPPRAWAEINQSHFLANLKIAREKAGCRVMAVLKAGAYGHGLEELAELLEREDVAFFGVASVVEARRLKACGIEKRVYLLGPTFPDERKEIIENNWIASLSSIEEAESFNRLNNGAKKPLSVHVTIDTGMGRGGFLPDQIITDFPKLLKMENIQIDGIGSHLPSADEDKEFTLKQFKRFDDLVAKLSNTHVLKYIHLANSAGLLEYSSEFTNLARPGLMLYGISPFTQYQNLLKPVMTLKSRVSIVRQLPRGHGVSYGRSYILGKDTLVATVGIGYGDGYCRHFSGKGVNVLINGEKCPLIGRVTMDQIMVDVSHLPKCASGDEVELFGENILVSELAEKSGLIEWEIFTGITPRVQRIYL